MNKKLIVFLSLFSLVLCLSVFYVLFPFSSATNDDNDAEVVNEVIEISPFYQEIETRDLSLASYKQERVLIISNSESTNEDKLLALTQIEVYQENYLLENSLEDMLKGIGFKYSFVEIKDDEVYVKTISNGEEEITQVAEIIFFIQEILMEEKEIYVIFKNI
jgi:hypothetical protein